MGSIPGRLAAGVAVVLCLGIGLVGLVLPIIPGLLFLAIAALIAARRFPSVVRPLRRNRKIDKHLDGADRFLRLSVRRKAQVGGLLCVKMLLDAAALAGSLVSRGTRLARRGTGH